MDLSKTRIYIGGSALSASKFAPRQTKRGVRMRHFGLIRSAFMIKKGGPVFIRAKYAGNIPIGLSKEDARFRSEREKIYKLYSDVLEENLPRIAAEFPSRAQAIIDALIEELKD